MGNMNAKKMQDRLEKYLEHDRFLHTQGVMYTATSLAMCHGVDLEKAWVAGLLHDCAKCIPTSKKLKLCKKYGIELSSFEIQNESLLHAKVGVCIARKKYNITDEEVLGAIRYHTTGRPEMTPLEKIVYIADYIEPGRFKAANLSKIREMAFRDLDETMYLILKDTLDYLNGTSNTLDDMTEKAYRYYSDLHQERKGGTEL